MTVEKIIQGLRYTISRFPKVRKQLTIGEEVVVDACEEAIKLLEANKWTLVVADDPTTLPKETDEYLVTTAFDIGAGKKGKGTYVRSFYTTSGKWSGLCDGEEVTAWMPLPAEPYKETSECHD